MYCLRFVFLCVLSVMFSQSAVATDLLDDGCNPTNTVDCALPFPSDFFTVADASSPTGKRVIMSNDLLPQNANNQLPFERGISLEKIYENSSGFSAASSVLFDFTAPVKGSSIPADGGESVVAFDITTGERVAIRAEYSFYARNRLLVKSASRVVEVFPRSRWKFGHQYIVATTSELKSKYFFWPFGTNKKFADARRGRGELADFYQPGFDLLESNGVDVSKLRSATVFTVRDREEVVQPMIDTVQKVYDNDHPVRNIYSFYPGHGDIGAYVFGQVRLDNYRSEGSGIVDFESEPVEQWVPFFLTIPRSAEDKKAPVAIYGHGVAALKELTPNIFSNAKLGIATIGIDFANHGPRLFQENGYVVLNAQPQKLPEQAGMVVGSTLDFVSLYKAIQSSLADLDVFPRKNGAGLISAAQDNGDGVADLDVDNISFQGSSLGGVLGLTFVAVAPELKGAYIHVAGVGVTPILSKSLLWDTIFQFVVPRQVSGAQALMFRAAMQQELDYGDAINFVDLLKEKDDRPVAVLVGVDDPVVSNQSTIALAELADLPLVGREYFSMGDGVRVLADYDNGDAVLQEQLNFAFLPFLNVALAHLALLTPNSFNQQEAWLQRFILEQ